MRERHRGPRHCTRLLISNIVERVRLEGKVAVDGRLNILTHQHQAQLLLPLRVTLSEVHDGFAKVVKTLALITHHMGTEEQQTLVSRQSECLARNLFITGAEEIDVYRIGNATYLLALQEAAIAGHITKPAATCHEVYVHALQQLHLALKSVIGHIVMLAAIHLQAIMAVCGVMVTVMSIVTHSGERPHIVHCPYDRFARSDYLLYCRERKHAVIDPMQVYDIGLLEFGEFSDAASSTTKVYGIDAVTAKVSVPCHRHTFPQHGQAVQKTALSQHRGELLSALAAHQHLGLDAIVLQGFGKAIGCNGRSALSLSGIDD